MITLSDVRCVANEKKNKVKTLKSNTGVIESERPLKEPSKKNPLSLLKPLSAAQVCSSAFKCIDRS